MATPIMTSVASLWHTYKLFDVILPGLTRQCASVMFESKYLALVLIAFFKLFL